MNTTKNPQPTRYQVTRLVPADAPAAEVARVTKIDTDLVLATASEHHVDLSNLRLTVTTESVGWGNGKTYIRITTTLTV